MNQHVSDELIDLDAAERSDRIQGRINEHREDLRRALGDDVPEGFDEAFDDYLHTAARRVESVN